MQSSTREPRQGSLRDIYGVLHNLVIGTVLLWVLVVALAVVGLIVGKAEVAQVRRDEALAIRALCFQRGTLDHQIAQTESFLKTHPHGIPGISRALFEQGIRKDEIARAALADIHCPKP